MKSVSEAGINVLNPKQLTAKIDILAQDINNVEAARWFARAVKFALTNPERISRPYRPHLKPWLSAQGVHGNVLPIRDELRDNLLKTVIHLGNTEDDIAVGVPGDIPVQDYERWQSYRRTMEPKASPKKRASKKKVAESTEDLVVKLKDAVKDDSDPDRIRDALLALLVSIGIDEEDASLAIEANNPDVAVAHLLKGNPKATEEIKRTARQAAPLINAYYTALHAPGWEERFRAEYTPYDPANPPKAEVPFGAPTTAPDWAKPGEAYMHFNPHAWTSRDLWKQLDAVVDYLNYMHHAAEKLKTSDNVEERTESEEGAKLMRMLVSADAQDTTLLLQVMDAASHFRSNQKSMLRRRSTVRIGTKGNLVAYRLTTPEAVITFSNLPSRWASGNYKDDAGKTIPDWCTKEKYRADSYFEQASGNVIGITKDDEPYVLLAVDPTGSRRTMQIKNARNGVVDAKMAAEIAPTLVSLPDSHLRGEIDLAPFVQRARALTQ